MTVEPERDLAAAAAQLVADKVAEIASENPDDDLSWLPTDFGERVIAIAWEHQFDIDTAMFRRKLNRFFDEIVATEA